MTHFVFDPPLPTLWSPEDVSEKHLKEACQSDEELQRVYDKALADFDMDNPPKMPISKFGKTKLSMPLISLGGGVLVHALVFRTGRALWGLFNPKLYLALNAILFPLVGVLYALRSFWVGDMASVGIALGMTVLCFAGSSFLVNIEHLGFGRKLLAKSIHFGINHIETARHYLTSEAYLGTLLCEGDLRSEVLLQTKIRPYTDQIGFEKTVMSSLRCMRTNTVELLSVHGINTLAHKDTVLSDNWLDSLRKLKSDGVATCVGFSTHLSSSGIIECVQVGYQLEFRLIFKHAWSPFRMLFVCSPAPLTMLTCTLGSSAVTQLQITSQW